MLKRIAITLLFSVAAIPGWTQMNMGMPSGESGMATPSPVNIGGGSVSVGAENERSNYLRGGFSFEGSYNDNPFLTTPPHSDEGYTVSPFLAFSMTRSRASWNLQYSPGFTFYQHFNSQNQSDHNLSTGLQFRLSPHVTMMLEDGLIKTSEASGQLEPTVVGGITTATPVQTLTVVAPETGLISNTAGGEITYQFSRNAMVGVSGDSSELHYLNLDQLPGLFDSSARGGQAFYSYRLGSKNYIGMTYSFEDIITHPLEITTQVHSPTFFYSIYFTQHISLSAFGGAQYAKTTGDGIVTNPSWSSTEGGSFSWQGEHTSAIASLSRSISPGGGLATAVHGISSSASLRHQFSPNVVGTISETYSNNNVLEVLALFSNGGTTLSTGASLQRTIKKHLAVQVGYTRLDESYTNIQVLSNNSSQNRGWMSISYSFERPLGR